MGVSRDGSPHGLTRRLSGKVPAPVRLTPAMRTDLRGVVVNGQACDCGSFLVAIRSRGPECLRCYVPMRLVAHD